METTLAHLALLTALASLTARCAGQPQLELANGGFETLETTAGSVPNTLTNWSGDYSTIRFLPEGGISPRTGSGMFQFLGTRSASVGSQVSSEMWQLVSLDPLRTLLDAGWSVTVTQTCYFNRVAGDVQTDTSMTTQLVAYDGSPATFPSRLDAGWLSRSSAELLADADPATWEPVVINLLIPPSAAFVVVKIQANENIFNDTVFPEFDGHFADDVSLTVGIYPPLPRLEIQIMPDGQTMLIWPTYRGFVYQLLRSPSLDTPAWQPVGDPYYGDDFPAFVTDPLVAGASQAYYRLRVTAGGP